MLVTGICVELLFCKMDLTVWFTQKRGGVGDYFYRLAHVEGIRKQQQRQRDMKNVCTCFCWNSKSDQNGGGRKEGSEMQNRMWRRQISTQNSRGMGHVSVRRQVLNIVSEQYYCSASDSTSAFSSLQLTAADDNLFLMHGLQFMGC